MRKILLGTTAVAGAALFAVSTAQAQQAPTVRIGGYMSVVGTSVSDDADKGVSTGAFTSTTRNSTSRQALDFRNDMEIVITVAGKAANGLEYGAVIEMQMDGINGTTYDNDEAYVFVSSPTLGTLRFGEEDSAANLMQVRVPLIAGMGTDGDWHDGLAATTADGTQRRIASTGPSLISSINGGSDATKIVYLSPQFAGFDFGVSFAPNAGEGERAWLNVQPDRTTAAPTAFGIGGAVGQRDLSGLSNELSVAIRYRGQFGPVGVAAGFGMMRAEAQNTTASVQDVTANTVGLNLSAVGFTVGGEYTWGKYGGESVGRAALAAGRGESSHWVIGATYVAGAIAVGAYYGVAEQAGATAATDRSMTVFGIGANYTLAPGLDLFAQYNQLKDENTPLSLASGQTTRDANVVTFGTRLAF